MHIAVIGNGVAGATSAMTISSLDSGSVVTLFSEERTALYSPCIFGHYLGGEIPHRQLFLNKLEEYLDQGMVLQLGQAVTDIDVKTRTIYSSTCETTYDKCILATGSEPLLPPIPGVNTKGVFTLKTISDLNSIDGYLRANGPHQAIVVGSGPIGIEIAVNLRRRGLEVILVELLTKVMPKLLDQEQAGWLQGHLEANGIQVLTGEKVLEIDGSACVEGVRTDQREIPGQMVCMAVGMKPRIHLASAMGLSIGKQGGICVDELMQTSVPNIYACGDCVQTENAVTGKPHLSMLWHTAKHQAFIAAYNCLQRSAKYRPSINTTVVDVFGKVIVSSGQTSHDLEAHPIEKDQFYSKGGVLTLFAMDGRLVSLQFFGDQPPEALGKLLCLIRSRASFDQLGKALVGDRFSVAGFGLTHAVPYVESILRHRKLD